MCLIMLAWKNRSPQTPIMIGREITRERAILPESRIVATLPSLCLKDTVTRQRILESQNQPVISAPEGA